MISEFTKGDFVISTDKRKLDLPLIHDFLANRSYWAQGLPMDVLKRSVKNSICFGIYQGEKQVGFARVISDCATFAYIADVFVLEGYRGQGLSKFLIESIKKIPDFKGLRRWTLATQDAHELYTQFGFQPLSHPERSMEILDREIYLRIKENI